MAPFRANVHMKIEDLINNVDDHDHLSSNEQTPLRPDAFEKK